MNGKLVLRTNIERNRKTWHFFIRRTDENEIKYLLQVLYGIDTQEVIDTYRKYSKSYNNVNEKIKLLLECTKEVCMQVSQNPYELNEQYCDDTDEYEDESEESYKSKVFKNCSFDKMDLYLITDALLHVRTRTSHENSASLWATTERRDSDIAYQRLWDRINKYRKMIASPKDDSKKSLIVWWHLNLNNYDKDEAKSTYIRKSLDDLTVFTIDSLMKNPFYCHSKHGYSDAGFRNNSEVQRQLLARKHKKGEQFCCLYILERLYATEKLMTLAAELENGLPSISEAFGDDYDESKALDEIIEAVAYIYLVQDCFDKETYCKDIVNILSRKNNFVLYNYWDEMKNATVIPNGSIAERRVASRIKMCKQYLLYLSTAFFPVLSSCFYAVLLSVAADDDFVNCRNISVPDEKIKVANPGIEISSEHSFVADLANEYLEKCLEPYKPKDLFNYIDCFDNKVDIISNKNQKGFKNKKHKEIFFRLYDAVKCKFGNIPSMEYWERMTDINYLEIEKGFSCRLRDCALMNKFGPEVLKKQVEETKLYNFASEMTYAGDENEEMIVVKNKSIGDLFYMCADCIECNVHGIIHYIYILIGVSSQGRCAVAKVCIGDADGLWRSCFGGARLDNAFCNVRFVFSKLQAYKDIERQISGISGSIKCLPYLREQRPPTLRPDNEAPSKGRPEETPNYREISNAVIKQMHQKRKVIEKKLSDEVSKKVDEAIAKYTEKLVIVPDDEALVGLRESYYREFLQNAFLTEKVEYNIDEEALRDTFGDNVPDNFDYIIEYIKSFIPDYMGISNNAMRRLYSDNLIRTFRKYFVGAKSSVPFFSNLSDLQNRLYSSIDIVNKEWDNASKKAGSKRKK